MLYANAYDHRPPNGTAFQFVGALQASREAADAAARHEMAIEPHTRRFGVWRIRPKVAS